MGEHLRNILAKKFQPESAHISRISTPSEEIQRSEEHVKVHPGTLSTESRLKKDHAFLQRQIQVKK